MFVIFFLNLIYFLYLTKTCLAVSWRFQGGFMAGFILWTRFVSHRSNCLYFSLLFYNFRCLSFNFLYCLYFSLMFFNFHFVSLILFTFLYLTKHVPRFRGGFMAGFILWARLVSHRSKFL